MNHSIRQRLSDSQPDLLPLLLAEPPRFRKLQDERFSQIYTFQRALQRERETPAWSILCLISGNPLCRHDEPGH
jgi:hypothetical protein